MPEPGQNGNQVKTETTGDLVKTETTPRSKGEPPPGQNENHHLVKTETTIKNQYQEPSNKNQLSRATDTQPSFEGMEAPKPVKPKTKAEIRKEQVLEVFAYWQSVLGYQHLRLTENRKKKIEARIKYDRFTVDQLKKVVDLVKDNPWWQGQGGNAGGKRFDDIVTIFRNNGFHAASQTS